MKQLLLMTTMLLMFWSANAQCNCSGNDQMRKCGVKYVAGNSSSDVYFGVALSKTYRSVLLLVCVKFSSAQKYISGNLNITLSDGSFISLKQTSSGEMVRSDSGVRLETLFEMSIDDMKALYSSSIAEFRVKYSSDNGINSQYIVSSNGNVVSNHLDCLVN